MWLFFLSKCTILRSKIQYNIVLFSTKQIADILYVSNDNTYSSPKTLESQSHVKESNKHKHNYN